MSNYIPKRRPTEAEKEIDENGAFVRQQNRFATPFGSGEGKLRAEEGRYRLIWAKSCNWSNRSAIVRELLGLEDAISVDIVESQPADPPLGWEFLHDEGGVDPVTGVRYLSELYYNADPNYDGRCTVPSFIDVKEKKVVNNDYHRLTNYLEVNFKQWQRKDAPNLYPEYLRKEIDEFNWWLFNNINNGVYKMQFAQSIGAYNYAFDQFYAGMDEMEARLGNRRFLFGDYVTDSDVRFYTTLARFDTKYYRNLGPLKGRVVDFKNIWGYARDLWEISAFRNNTYFLYFAESSKRGNGSESYSVKFWDKIDYEALWSTPQNRKEMSKTPGQKFLID